MYKTNAKKIISILLVMLFLGSNLSFAQICDPECSPTKNCVCDLWNCRCVENNTPTPPGWWTTSTPTEFMGITCNEDQLANGQCKLNIYKTLGIRQNMTESPTSVGLFVQDIVLSATFFIGTLVTVALIVSGLMFIFAASSGKDPANAKKWIIWSLLGLLIVVSSYIIIRLVQYIAKGF